MVFPLFVNCGGEESSSGPYDPFSKWTPNSSYPADGDAVIATTAADYSIDATSIRYQETALGNLIADGMAAYARFATGKPVSFAIMNGQGVQSATTISAGDITNSQITNLDANDKLYVKTYTGAEISEIINAFVTSNDSSHWLANCALLVSKGVSYTINTFTIGKDPNATITPLAVNIKINGADLVSTDKYTVAVTNFMATGNFNKNINGSDDEGNPIGIGDPNSEKDCGVEVGIAVANYVYTLRTLTPDNVKVEGRITGVEPTLP